MAIFLFRSNSPRLGRLAGVVLLSASLLMASCDKKPNPDGNLRHGAACSAGPEQPVTTDPAITAKSTVAPLHQTLSSVVTVADVRAIEGSADVEVIFNENTQFFNASGTALVQLVKEALASNKQLKIAFDPWAGELISAAYTDIRAEGASSRGVVDGKKGILAISAINSYENLDNPAEMGILNTTDPGLNNLIPDFATAQLMFDYITRQCCYLPGPYAVDHCIPFQYCIDGCYARAHKMCWIINNRYKYGTKKIFSFANATPDKLCVQGQKWGGCCIRWWYHVAPLVTVKTPTGPKAYVFDPAMFNQPVLLSTWLHAQENPACASTFNPHVTMINVQPTSSYAPMGSSGTLFSTDPMYSATNNTLDNYSALVTCP